ncbi:protein of unknown function (plasmid) [Streptantibioticus cattleyicolor NRRL 8057 = DSM 46488]|nr:protein of unknown function [Streptantibioticus cattleyicolor NRRL 8057 = DSM 46488]
MRPLSLNATGLPLGTVGPTVD